MAVKKRVLINPVFIFFMMLPFWDCSDKGTNISPGAVAVQYLSFKDNGCTSKNSIQKTQVETVLNYGYSQGILTLNLLFTVNCASEIKDSVIISENNINIYLADTSKGQVRCICPTNEEFNFRTDPGVTIFIQIFYKAYGNIKYSLLVKRAIEI